jgi:hypothetical protein
MTLKLLSYQMLSDFRNSTALSKVHKLWPSVVLVKEHVDNDDDEYGALMEWCWKVKTELLTQNSECHFVKTGRHSN